MTALLPSPTVLETTVAGLAIRAERKGDGPIVVVLHHSFGSPGWLPFYDDLAADFTVIVPHLPGFGLSDRPDWARHPRDLALLLRHWLRKQTDDAVTLVGCGFGGWLAAEMATMAPDAIGRLVLVGAAGLVPATGRILDQMGIRGKESLFPSDLSAGEKQRVALARAMARHPRILIADEPTGNLDPVAATQIFGLLREINARGALVLVATHAEDWVRRHPGRVIRLERGILRSDAPEGDPSATAEVLPR